MQVNLVEVETRLADRIKTYWTPLSDLQGHEHTATDASSRGALLCYWIACDAVDLVVPYSGAHAHRHRCQ